MERRGIKFKFWGVERGWKILKLDWKGRFREVVWKLGGCVVMEIKGRVGFWFEIIKSFLVILVIIYFLWGFEEVEIVSMGFFF